MTDTITCSNCGTENAAKAIFCTNCGTNLRDVLNAQDYMDSSQTQFVMEPDERLVTTLHQRKAYLGRAGRIKFRLLQFDDLLLEPEFKIGVLTMGRSIESGEPIGNHVDLSRFKAKELGVSRKHARLIRVTATVVIEDMGALNGTFVNGERLSPVRPCVLCHGDEINLGNLAIEVIFDQS